MVENYEFEARNQAKLDAIYERERSKYSSLFNNNQSDNNSNYDNTRLSYIENRLNCIENRINELHGMIINIKESNGLFVFAPKGNINSAVSFQLSESQFREMMNSIVNK
jgi:hypothetical protein